MMHFKKTFLALYVVFCVLMVFGVSGSVDAAAKKFGEECSNGLRNNECTGDCEEADSDEYKEYNDKLYCTCRPSHAVEDCKEAFGRDPEAGERWTCDETDTFNLHFCKSSIPGKDVHAGPGANQYSTWAGVTQMLTDDEIKKMISKPALKINIPGLKFSEPTGQNEGDGTYLFVNYIGEYVRAMYRYGVAAASILAVIMIIKAGFMWSVSGGSSDVISKQKETIEKSIVGLVIAVSSYTILFAINPKLVEFNSLKVEYTKGIGLGYATPAVDEPTPFGPMTASEGNNGVPYFAQFSGPWALRSPVDMCNSEGKPCGPAGDKRRDKECVNPKPCEPAWSQTWNGPKKETDPQYCDTIWQRGCGSTSFAMIMAYYGFQTDPFDVARWSLSCKGVFPIDKTVGDKKRMQEKWPGINAQWLGKKTPREKLRSKIIESLKNNNPILYNCHPCEGKNRAGGEGPRYDGHFMVITGFHDEKDKQITNEEEMEKIYININDPGGNRQILHSIETMTLGQALDNFLVAGFFQKE